VGQVGQGEGGLQILVGQVEQGEGGLEMFVGQVGQGQGVCPLEPFHLSQMGLQGREFFKKALLCCGVAVFGRKSIIFKRISVGMLMRWRGLHQERIHKLICSSFVLTQTHRIFFFAGGRSRELTIC